MLNLVTVDRFAWQVLPQLSRLLKESEADRTARLEQIVELTKLSGELNERLNVIQTHRIYSLLKKIKLML
jgi:hypothetical protein